MMTLTLHDYVALPQPQREQINEWMTENDVPFGDCFEIIEAQGSYAFHCYESPRKMSGLYDVASWWDVRIDPTRPLPVGCAGGSA